jgi:hypothetical protein
MHRLIRDSAQRAYFCKLTTVCVILSLMARGEIMLCAKVCWWVGRGGFSDPCRVATFSVKGSCF